MQAVMSCSECGERLQPAEVTPLVGPGLQAALDTGFNMFGNNGDAPVLPPLLQKSVDDRQPA